MDGSAVTTVINLFVVVKGLIDKYKKAPKEIANLEVECELTKTLCTELKRRISADPKDGKDPQDRANESGRTLTWCIKAAMSALENTLDDLQKNLNELLRMGKTARKIGFMLREDYFKEASQDVTTQRGIVDSALGVIQFRILTNPGYKRPPGNPRRQPKDLRTAIQNGEPNKVTSILLGGDVNVDSILGNNGDRALHIAAQEGFWEVLRRLLAHEADVNLQNYNLDTPLHLVLQRADTKMLMMLLSQGADWEKANSKGLTPLHVAAQRSVTPVVQYLLDRGADPNVPDNLGQTPLFLACNPLNKAGKEASKVDVRVIRILLNAKADPAVGDRERGRTPVHELAYRGATKGLRLVARHLKDAGKSVDLHQNGGQTPLQLAIANDESEAVDVLVTFKANVDARQTLEDGRKTTPLWHAAHRGNLAIVTRLLAAGAKTDVKDRDYTRLLQFAVKRHWLELARLLLQPADGPGAATAAAATPKTRYPVDLNAQGPGKDAGTPLHAAVNAKNVPMARLLLSAGAAVDLPGGFGGTPFMCAAQAGSLALMRLLLAHGAAWSHTTPQGTDAFVWACSQGQVVAASFLLGCGQDIDVRSRGDYTALHYAAARKGGHPDTVRWLLELGIDKGVRATEMRPPFKATGTAAEVARAHGLGDIAKIIDEFRG